MIIRADARRLPLLDGCVQTCVTSPPYFGLRDYGSSHQIGLEATPDAYVASLVQVFRDVRRVLKDDGCIFVNLGDSYSAKPCADGSDFKDGRANRGSRHSGGLVVGLKPKDLIGIPWMVAFALRADGWYLRSDIIWAKPNPMPESVTDRPTKAHEYLFLLSKCERYHYDADAIAEASASGEGSRAGYAGYDKRAAAMGRAPSGNEKPGVVAFNAETRNKRSVWTVPTMPYSGAHFATFPEKLIEPCILAGCPLGGLVLDPFLGSGTVGAVAERLGRRWVGTDLSYQPLSKARTAQRGIRFEQESA